MEKKREHVQKSPAVRFATKQQTREKKSEPLAMSTARESEHEDYHQAAGGFITNEATVRGKQYENLGDKLPPSEGWGRGSTIERTGGRIQSG